MEKNDVDSSPLDLGIIPQRQPPQPQPQPQPQPPPTTTRRISVVVVLLSTRFFLLFWIILSFTTAATHSLKINVPLVSYGRRGSCGGGLVSVTTSVSARHQLGLLPSIHRQHPQHYCHYTSLPTTNKTRRFVHSFPPSSATAPWTLCLDRSRSSSSTFISRSPFSNDSWIMSVSQTLSMTTTRSSRRSLRLEAVKKEKNDDDGGLPLTPASVVLSSTSSTNAVPTPPPTRLALEDDNSKNTTAQESSPVRTTRSSSSRTISAIVTPPPPLLKTTTSIGKKRATTRRKAVGAATKRQTTTRSATTVASEATAAAATTLEANGDAKVVPTTPQSSTTKTKAKTPAAVVVAGSVPPPKGWEDIYSLVVELRQDRTAPCDISGCEALAAGNGVVDNNEKTTATTANGSRASTTCSPPEFRLRTLIALMLSSQTKDAIVGEAVRHMIQDGVLNVPALLAMSPERLCNHYLAKVGFRNNKTKYIAETVRILHEQYQDDIPPTAARMIEQLPGVGPKMAYICETVAWNIQSGIGVDTHMHRIFTQLGWVNKQTCKTPEHTRQQLQAWLPHEYWADVNILWVGFGQEVQQEKPKILRKALVCSQPAEALRLLKRCGLDFNKEAIKLNLQDEVQRVLANKPAPYT